MIWFLVILLIIIVVGAVIWPLWRHTDKVVGTNEVAYFDAQLADIDRDLAAGILNDREAKVVMKEAEARLKAAKRRAEKETIRTTTPVFKKVTMCLTLLAPIAAIALYLLIGNPALSPDKVAIETALLPQEIGSAVQGEASVRALEASIAKLEARLEQDPRDIEGWKLLGQAHAVSGDFEKAIPAFEQATALSPKDVSIKAAYADVLIQSQEGEITDKAVTILQEVVKLDPQNAQAQFYLANYAYQQGDKREALAALIALQKDAPKGAPWVRNVQTKIVEIAGELEVDMASLDLQDVPRGPTQEQIAAAREMSEEDRMQMISGMVEGLAARLGESPGDFEGWVRLGRSYGILGDAEKAIDALGKAIALQPDSIDARIRQSEAMLTGWSGPQMDVPDGVLVNVNAVLKLQSNNPFALYFAGVAAMQKGDNTEARLHLEALLVKMPEAAEERRQIEKLLASL